MWTDETVARLREQWVSGASASVIAAALGTSRNAVLGKVHRLKLPARKTLSTAPKAIANRKRAVRLGLPTPTRRYERAPNRPYIPPAPVAEATPRFIALFDLMSGDCRWPMNEPPEEYLFCASAVLEGSPYCAAHHQLAYRPQPDRRSVNRNDVCKEGGGRKSVSL